MRAERKINRGEWARKAEKREDHNFLVFRVITATDNTELMMRSKQRAIAKGILCERAVDCFCIESDRWL